MATGVWGWRWSQLGATERTWGQLLKHGKLGQLPPWGGYWGGVFVVIAQLGDPGDAPSPQDV